MLEKYPYASTFLAKAILISSCSQLRDSNHATFSELAHGFGRPHYDSAISLIQAEMQE
jgi:hypothetical protein